jgi:hypothetical protein
MDSFCPLNIEAWNLFGAYNLEFVISFFERALRYA